jgi:hypothetical protein
VFETPYFHVVLMLPNALGPVARANPRVVYSLLMRAAAETLLELAANPKLLGAEVGALAVLRTWDQSLALQPHSHCVVTAGAWRTFVEFYPLINRISWRFYLTDSGRGLDDP